MLILDARAAERYRGDAEPVDPRAGHIPGAKSAPFSGNLTPGPIPVFLPPAALRERYAALGAERVAADRLLRVRASPPATTCWPCAAAGLSGSLYAGSWSEWSADPALPVATGEAP